MKVIIVGGVAGGATAAARLRRLDEQAEINALALEANEKRYQAYCLEQEALKIMDEEVIYCK